MIKKILLAGMFALSTVACGGDECDDAADKADECDLPKGEGEGSAEGDDVECSGLNECLAKCINDASCEELKSNDINSNYLKCAAACTQ